MKLLIFSDIHSDLKALDRLMQIEADYYFCAGDLVNWGRKLDLVGEILKKHADRMYVVPGNHESPQQITDLCNKFGLHDFHGGHLELDGFHVVGLGCSNPTPFDTPGEYSEEEIQERLRPFAGLKPAIAVLHCPPFGTMLDRITNLRHAGSKSVRAYIEHEQPRYFFCGHIHEAAGTTDTIGACSAMNVGKKGFLLDLHEQRQAGLI